tara:strand:- start:81 stop:563 length:483 start_codon:yes stop_codon:yes gene_type:complete
MTAADTPAPEGPPESGPEKESILQLAIRPASAADSAALAALWEACGLTRPWNDPAKDIGFARAGSASDILVGCEGERIVASVMVGHDGHRGAVYYMAVDPARRGKGFGQMMMAAAESWLKTRGMWKLNLMVRRENKGVIGFYEGLGYEPSDVVVMGKWLE